MRKLLLLFTATTALLMTAPKFALAMPMPAATIESSAAAFAGVEKARYHRYYRLYGYYVPYAYYGYYWPYAYYRYYPIYGYYGYGCGWPRRSCFYYGW